MSTNLTERAAARASRVRPWLCGKRATLSVSSDSCREDGSLKAEPAAVPTVSDPVSAVSPVEDAASASSVGSRSRIPRLRGLASLLGTLVCGRSGKVVESSVKGPGSTRPRSPTGTGEKSCLPRRSVLAAGSATAVVTVSKAKAKVAVARIVAPVSKGVRSVGKGIGKSISVARRVTSGKGVAAGASGSSGIYLNQNVAKSSLSLVSSSSATGSVKSTSRGLCGPCHPLPASAQPSRSILKRTLDAVEVALPDESEDELLFFAEAIPLPAEDPAELAFDSDIEDEQLAQSSASDAGSLCVLVGSASAAPVTALVPAAESAPVGNGVTTNPTAEKKTVRWVESAPTESCYRPWTAQDHPTLGSWYFDCCKNPYNCQVDCESSAHKDDRLTGEEWYADQLRLGYCYLTHSRGIFGGEQHSK